MKKMIALLLFSLMLCGCTVSVPISGTNAADPTQPVDVESIELIPIDSWDKDTGLVLNINIDKNPAFKQTKDEAGTEFEMVLNKFHCILEVTPLGEKAEKLLSGTDFTGVFYQTAMADILVLAQQQQLIEISTIITVSATAVGQDSWTIASYNVLERPIEIFLQNCGVIFSYKLNAAGKYFDEKDYTETETHNTEINEGRLYDGTPYINYSRATAGRFVTEMSTMTRPDGTYEEQYIPAPGQIFYCSYHPDGSFSFGAGYDNGFDTYYTIFSDNTIEANSRYHIDGITLKDAYRDRDGNIHERYFEDLLIVKLTTYYTDGRIEEFYYNSEGHPIPAPTE